MTASSAEHHQILLPYGVSSAYSPHCKQFNGRGLLLFAEFRIKWPQYGEAKAMKQHPWVTYSAFVAAVVQLVAAAFVPIPAQAGAQDLPHSKTGIVMGGHLRQDDATYQVQVRHDLNNLSGLKGVTLSLGRPDYTTGVHLETAVLIKPLNMENFFVTFAAGKPVAPNRSHTVSAATPEHQLRGPPIKTLSGSNRRDLGMGWTTALYPQRPTNERLADQRMTANWKTGIGDGTNWYSKVALAYSPSQQWTVRAVLSMEYSDLKNLPLLSSHIVDQSRIGMAIDVDYQILESMILGFDYGHYHSGQNFEADAIASKKTLQQVPENDPTQGQVFSAKLKIRF